MFENSTKSQKQSGIAWVILVVALAIHVADEALTGFLPFYNSIVVAIRESYPLFPMPVFTFPIWLGGLVVAVIAVISLSPLVFRGNRALHYLSYVLSTLMLLNGLGHIGASFYFGILAPGVYSSPLLILAGGALLFSTTKSGRVVDAGV